MAKQKRLKNFKIQKAMPYSPKRLLDRKKQPTHEKYIEEGKLDGLRGIVIVRLNGEKFNCTAYTSTGVEVPNAAYICHDINIASMFPGFKQQLIDDYYCKWEKDYLSDGFVLDGEFFADDWNLTQSIVKTQTYDDNLAKQLKLNAFDILSIHDWDRKSCDWELADRKRWLSTALHAIHSKRILELSYVLYNSLSDKDVQKCLAKREAQGVEGTMLKRYHGMYMFKRSADWLKLKPVKNTTYDLKIIGYKEEEDKYGKKKGTLGSLKLKGTVEGQKIVVWCGGGYKRNERIQLWKERKTLVGKIAEVKFDNITSGKSLRFPRFKRFRWDKA